MDTPDVGAAADSAASPPAADGAAIATLRDREAATREVLEIVGRSREDAQPVFDAILRSVSRLCAAPLAFISAPDETRTRVRIPTCIGARPEFAAILAEYDEPLEGTRLVANRPILEGRVVHVHDCADDDVYRERDPRRVQLVEVEGVRTILGAPMLSDGVAVGAIILYRREVAPFSPDEIALVETFAAQAAIAVEKVRQFQEMRERLEHEAATREVLGLISRSRDDDAPVFDCILRNAQTLCGSQTSLLVLGAPGDQSATLTAHCGMDDALVAAYRAGRLTLDPERSFTGQAMAERRPIHVPDMRETDRYRAGDPATRMTVDIQGVRTNLYVPLIAAEGPIGCIIVFRTEVRPYAESQIALVEEFAAQAVIAIENVRQFRALQERLEREAATREILEVISRSRSDETPVFQTILRNAATLCGAPLAGLNIADEAGTHLVLAAHHGPPLRHFAEGETRWPLDGSISLAVAARERRAVQIIDLADTDLYRSGDPIRVRAVNEEGIRTFLAVPLVGGNDVVGCIGLYRREVRAFTAEDIALLEAFAAQAVIAIENVRQFRELKSRLEREAATREILEVISSSRDDEQPVFDVILENACRLCAAPSGAFVMGRKGDAQQHMVAGKGVLDETFEAYQAGQFTMEPGASNAADAILERRTLYVEDLAKTEKYLSGDPRFRALVDEQGIRTNLYVPLISGGEGIGCLILFRPDVKPYTPDQMALVRTFAAQAVIAIENVRQFKALEASNQEVQALNAGLEARVEDQVGEIERMGRLKRFLSPAVADAVVSSGEETLLSSHRALIAVLFCDIRGFTAFCETAEPEETIEVLQRYHEEMGGLLSSYGSGVDHRSGDGIMAIFNDPLPCDDPAGDALRMALAMRERMATLCAEWRKLGIRLGFGVGISLGYATVGMVGSAGRYDYTASGTTVNLAARLCDEAGDGDILLSPRAYRAVEPTTEAEPFGELTLKGIQTPVDVFKVTGLKDQV